MMQQEFEKLTGFFPSMELYHEIESAYMESNMDKKEFCAAYVKNEKGMAAAIASKCNVQSMKRDTEAKKRVAELEADLKAEQLLLQDAMKALETEQEWKPYECGHNVKQADYEKLARDVEGGSAHYMDDAEAKKFINEEFGFDASKVTIRKTVEVEEIDRHGRTRRTGWKLERRPVYSASDYYYLLFNCAGRAYEVTDGELKAYWE